MNAGLAIIGAFMGLCGVAIAAYSFCELMQAHGRGGRVVGAAILLVVGSGLMALAKGAAA